MKPFDSFWIFLFYLLMPTMVACVGPTTPFGAIDSVVPETQKSEGKREVAVDSTFRPQVSEYKEPMIHFYPEKQVLHDRSEFRIRIADAESIPAHFGFKIMHNNRNVTQQFLKTSRIEKTDDEKIITFIFDDLRLRVNELNDISVIYERGDEEVYTARYMPPTCSLFDSQRVTNFHGFRGNKKSYIPIIEQIARQAQFNPSFLTGIVAQESGFNPRAVSWAKAIGLTQITPLAERELIKRQKIGDVWPRFPGINRMHYLKLKSKILTGEITPQKEWRLNPRYSLEGGVTYINYLKRYWDLPNNKSIIQSLPGDFNINLSQIILASYNSGAARVKAAIVSKGQKWKSHPKLKEANKYVQKVSSYCYHFSTEESS